MSGTSDDDERQKHLLEGEKLRLEVRKMRSELSIWSRIAAIIIPIALAVIGAAQTYLALSDMRSKDAREVRDLELKQIESGMKLVEFARGEAKHIASPDPNEAKQAMTYVSTLLPPDMACQMLNAVVVGVRVVNDMTDYAAQMRAQIAQGTSPPPRSCIIKPRDLQDQAIIANSKQPEPVSQGTPAQTAPVAPSPSASPTSACEAPKTHGPVLAVYYQIVRPDDRDAAATIGRQMPAQFPSAGIELVAQTDPSKQRADVRYYHAGQESDAKYLSCLLTAAYGDVVHGSGVQFGVTSLADRYKNLPANRVEVWFPIIHG